MVFWPLLVHEYGQAILPETRISGCFACGRLFCLR